MKSQKTMRSSAAIQRIAEHSQRLAFTLVELLVVIAIIGVLVALLLPAIQAAREAARNSQCKNSLRQIGLAMLNFESSNKTFPSGGWSFGWMGDPELGVGPRQPGGWIYQVGPYLENQNVNYIGGGLNGAALMAALRQQAAATNPTFNCPSRRPAIAYPALEEELWNMDNPELAAKSDYAANAGHIMPMAGALPEPKQKKIDLKDCAAPGFPSCKWVVSDDAISKTFTGIVGCHTGARIGQITDGTSKTAAACEKWVYVDYYEVATKKDISQKASDNPGDNGSMYQGYDQDTLRAIGANFSASGEPQGNLPTRDTEGGPLGESHKTKAGSAHPAGVNVAMCDGSVNSYDFDINPLVWNGIGGREDGDLN